ILLVISGGRDQERPEATAPRRPAPGPPAPRPRPAARTLTVGVTEANANLIASRQARPDVGAFTPWRDRLSALRPRYFRLAVDWAQLQPDPNGPIHWDKPAGGCMRGQPPCVPYAGLRDVLRAVRSQQQDIGR